MAIVLFTNDVINRSIQTNSNVIMAIRTLSNLMLTGCAYVDINMPSTFQY